MTKKQFTIDVETENYENAYFEEDKFLCYEDDYDAILKRLNELAEEKLLLKEKEKDMLNYLKKEYDYVYNQRMKHLDDAVLVTCYELIEYHIKSMIEHLEGL